MNSTTELSHESRDLLIYSAHEILWTASSLASQVQTPAQLQQYRHLLTVGITSLETVVNDRNCPQITRCYTMYILAQVLYCETACLDRVEALLSKGIGMATQSALWDLVLQMECLNVRVLSSTNRKAALYHCSKCLDKFATMQGNYSYYTLQMYQFDLTLDVSRPQAFAISAQWQGLPDGPPKSFLVLYGLVKALDLNLGQTEAQMEVLEQLRNVEQAANLAYYVPQVTMLRLMVTLMVALQRDHFQPVKDASDALEQFLAHLNAQAANKPDKSWDNWYVDGSIKLTGGQGSTFNIQWLTQQQCVQLAYLLIGLARLRHYKTKPAARELLKTCISLTERSSAVPQASSFSHVSDALTHQLKLQCTAQLYLALVEFCSLAFKKGRRALDRFVALSAKLPEKDAEELQSFSWLVAGVGAHAGGRPEAARQYYERISPQNGIYWAAIGNICCLDPSEQNLALLKQTLENMPPEHHVVKHAMGEIIQLAQNKADQTLLQRQESMQRAWRALNMGMTQQLSYVCSLVCVDRFDTIAEKTAAMESSLQAAVAASDCVWAYVVGLKNEELLHQLGQQDKLDGLHRNMDKVKGYVSMLIEGKY
ncbi:hypothetical protein CJU89_6192 [Yarrowia sp. B02]|nr:hypothetical protein CJU89_6192 [Yarrowia sp. B02]